MVEPAEPSNLTFWDPKQDPPMQFVFGFGMGFWVRTLYLYVNYDWRVYVNPRIDPRGPAMIYMRATTAVDSSLYRGTLQQTPYH